MQLQYRRLADGSLPTAEPRSPEQLVELLCQLRGSYPDEDRTLQALPSPDLMKNLDRAAALVIQHIKADNGIIIIGDYDADGATSTALLKLALHEMGATQLDYIIPSRHTHGYGLTSPIIDIIKDRHDAKLLITVDNGIAAIDGIEHAKQLGYEVLVTDHHLPGEQLPAADCIINPNLRDCGFPSKNIAGVAVAFYLVIAIRRQLTDENWFAGRQQKPPNLAQWLDLVAIGTICDVVKLDQTNRLLVEQGLQRIRKGFVQPGVRALLSTIDNKPINLINSIDIGFGLGPKINAAGRLDDMTIGIECLIAENEQQAAPLVNSLNQLNLQRREIEADILQEAIALVENTIDLTTDKIICLYQPHWHSGVVGIIASRIKSQFYRPVIIFGQDDDNDIKGSARSIKGCHLRDFLDWLDRTHPNLLEKFGGHAMAAGMTVKAENFEAFRAACQVTANEWLPDLEMVEQYTIDLNLPSSDLTTEHALALRLDCPWGNGFEAPIFEGKFEVSTVKIVGGKHFKFQLLTNESEQNTIDAIAFNPSTSQPLSGEKINCLYQLEINAWAGRVTPQLIIQQFWQ
jgi:single-stranded-DNA-specific exonuclease